MADEAEKKKIAELEFGVQNAKDNLDEINKKLQQIAQSSEIYSKKIGKNIGSSLDFSKVINVDSLSKQLAKVTEISEKDAKRIVTNIMKNEQDLTTKIKIEQERRLTDEAKSNNKMLVSEATTADKISVIHEDKNAKIEIEELKHANKMEEYNARQELSAKKMYDKIASLAKTYIVYKGFNELKKAVKDTIDSMVELETQMVAIDRVLNDSTVNISDYRDKLLGIASDYGNEMSNVTDVALRLAQAGFDQNEVLGLTEKTMLALNTADLNATQATDDMVAIMAQWGKMTGDTAQEMEDYGLIIDKVNKVADNFPTTSADVMDALKKVSSAFNLAGASMNETIATIVATEKASQRGGKEIGTALSNIVQQLKDEKRLDIAESLGLDFFKDANKTEFKNIMDIFQEMANRMQALKDAGKENSVEMQNLLSIFTVFRRNLGASLLGEMSASADGLSTYEKVLEELGTAAGYSMAENEKYLKTAKAAQAQFNNELLRLKTEIWEGGLEDVYKEMLKLGIELVQGIENFVKKFQNANKLLQKETALNASEYKKESDNVKEILEKYKTAGEEYEKLAKKKEEAKNAGKDTSLIDKDIVDKSQEIYSIQEQINEILKESGQQMHLVSEETDEYGKKVLKVNDAYDAQIEKIKAVSYEKNKQYVSELKKVAELAKENYTLEALNFDKKETKMMSKVLGLDETDLLFSGVNSNGSRQTIEEQYNMLVEWEKKLIEAGQYGTTAYDKVVNAAKNLEKQQQDINEKTQAYVDALGEMYLNSGAVSNYSEALSNIAKTFSGLEGPKKLITELQELNLNFTNGKIKSSEYFNGLQEKIKEIDFSALKNLQLDIKEMGKQTVSDTKELGNEVKEITQLTAEEMENLQAYEAIFAETTSMVAENIETLRANYESGKQNWVEYSENLGESAENALELYTQLNNLDLDEESQKWLDAGRAVDEYATSLQESINNLNELNPLLKAIGDSYDYIAQNSTVAGEALFQTSQIGETSYKNLATNVAQSLSDMVQKDSQAAKRIIDNAYKTSGYTTESYDYSYKSISENLQKDSKLLNNVLNQSTIEAAAAAGNVSAGVGNILDKLGDAISSFKYNIEATPYITGKLGIKKDENGLPTGIELPRFGFDINGKGGASIQGLSEALKGFGTGLANKGAYEFAYKPVTSGGGGSNNAPNKPNIDTSGLGGSGGSSGSKGSGGSSNYHADKEAEEQYKKDLKLFTDYVTNKEKLEEKWVKRQQDLEQLTDKDYLYITQQRIGRYQQYLNELKKMTWINDEDRIELENKYIDEIKDAEVEYFKFAKKQMQNEIKELQDANKEKIQLIKDEAQARIDALKKQKEETSRIRSEEKYDEKRQEILEKISYWEQRTGKEARESLKEARENLADLDKDWREQLEDWSIEDQIQAIEDERDAQIKAIEDSQTAEIEAMQKAYDEKVKMYVETGRIIYDQSVIQSTNLYNSYKENFVNPIMSDLDEIQRKIGQGTSAKTSSSVSSSSASSSQYETYTIKSGDTLSAIAKKYDTTVSKLMSANPQITNKNKIYAGKTLQIPKFHDGGIVGGNQEAFALLKPNEVILKTEWAESLNRMMKYFDGITTGRDMGVTTGSSIEVKGNMVNIEANIKNETDMNNLTKKIERMLENKFNIKK